MPEIQVSVTDTMDMTYEVCSFLGTPHYGCVANGDIYFNERLNGSPWTTTTTTRKEQALIEATFLIDRLNIRGYKASSTQRLQFPRGTDESVPTDIEYATYEIAVKLLDGIDIDKELEKAQVASRRYADVSTTYYRNSQMEYLNAGIPSSKAWLYIKPYLRNPDFIRLNKC
jgi:hypothetical protein